MDTALSATASRCAGDKVSLKWQICSTFFYRNPIQMDVQGIVIQLFHIILVIICYFSDTICSKNPLEVNNIDF
jgi:hypothetical protein